MSVQIPQKVVPGQPIVPELDVEQKDTVGKVQHARRYIAGPGTKIQEFNVGTGNQDQTVKVVIATVLGDVLVMKRKQDIVKDNDVAMEDEARTAENKEDNIIDITEYTVSVGSKGNPSSVNSPALPQVGDLVLARITRMTSKQAHVEILTVEGKGPVLKDSGVGSAGAELSGFSGTAYHNPTSGSVAGSVMFTQTIGATTSGLNSHPSDLGENFKGLIRSQDIRATERDKVQVVQSFKPGDIVRAEIISLGDGANYYLSTAKNELGVVLARAHSGTGELLYPLDYETMVSPKTGQLESRKAAKPF